MAAKARDDRGEPPRKGLDHMRSLEGEKLALQIKGSYEIFWKDLSRALYYTPQQKTGT